MDEGIKTFALGYVTKRMTVQFSPEGLDIIHCLLLRWAAECWANAESARLMEKDTDNPLLKGQADYWRNAGSFLKGKLLNNTAHKFNCYNELKTLAKLLDDGSLPHGWEVFTPIETTPDLPYGTGSVITGGSGSGGDGEDRPTGKGKGRGGKSNAGKGDGSHPAPDTASPGSKDGKGANRKGKGGTRGNRGRGGQRKPAGNEA